ncbi:MAG: NADH:ubiquinone reductase (Na(+)-transporting) subunit F [Sinimarinibacterium flocculans]|uniref:NADH:ubiquinone reductase (Na(+)-transporting) subunit F n=1 Tax=Sinimarinibacterium flocculans TaxID=985250 RepID=UPI003C690DF3
MSYQITVEPVGQNLEANEGQTLLDACLRAGVWLPHACGHGLCGTCKVQVVDGEIDLGPVSPFALMDFEREERKCLACCAVPLSDVVIEAEIDEDPDARHIPIADFNATVTRIVDLTPTIKGIHLALDGEGMSFQAGQYVNVHIPGETHPRAFSLAQSPQNAGEIELNVRRVPGGAGTAYLHEKLNTGDTLRVTGPYGRFFVRKSDPRPLLFMAGGSGLSSPKSMILDLLEQGETRQITLVYGARNRAELYYDALFRELAELHPNFEYLPALSEPTEACAWAGFKGFVHEAAAERFGGDFRGQRAYLCGPPPMIEACIRTLMQGRLFERDIFTEKFLSGADAGATRSPLFKAL